MLTTTTKVIFLINTYSNIFLKCWKSYLVRYNRNVMLTLLCLWWIRVDNPNTAPYCHWYCKFPEGIVHKYCSQRSNQASILNCQIKSQIWYMPEVYWFWLFFIYKKTFTTCQIITADLFVVNACSSVLLRTLWFCGAHIKETTCQLQGLFVPVARLGSGDSVRVLRLFQNKCPGYSWSINCWWLCTTCHYQN